jgi:hypothetical protein
MFKKPRHIKVWQYNTVQLLVLRYAQYKAASRMTISVSTYAQDSRFAAC